MATEAWRNIISMVYRCHVLQACSVFLSNAGRSSRIETTGIRRGEITMKNSISHIWLHRIIFFRRSVIGHHSFRKDCVLQSGNNRDFHFQTHAFLQAVAPALSQNLIRLVVPHVAGCARHVCGPGGNGSLVRAQRWQVTSHGNHELFSSGPTGTVETVALGRAERGDTRAMAALCLVKLMKWVFAIQQGNVILLQDQIVAMAPTMIRGVYAHKMSKEDASAHSPSGSLTFQTHVMRCLETLSQLARGSGDPLLVYQEVDSLVTSIIHTSQ